MIQMETKYHLPRRSLDAIAGAAALDFELPSQLEAGDE